MSKVHIIGAGLAGLSAAVSASRAGHSVTLYEATSAAGGRCRSYFDTELGMRLDVTRINLRLERKAVRQSGTGQQLLGLSRVIRVCVV